MTRIGWLGTGRMGTAMAARLIDAGEHVTVWNRTGSQTEPLAPRGAGGAGTPGGLLAAPRRPEVIVDCSTVSADVSARVREAAERAGVAFLAAPVSGNPQVVAGGGGRPLRGGAGGPG